MSDDRPQNNGASATPAAGAKKRFNLELFLPLGGMIIVGITSLILGLLFYDPPDKDNEPLDLPTLEEYEENRLRNTNAPPPDTPEPADAGPDAG